MRLIWESVCIDYQDAILGDMSDGVQFTLSHHPTCYRRGPWRLLIEVLPGDHHHEWGCLDYQDQPMRYYHSEVNAKQEADLIAEVLLKDRLSVGSLAEKGTS